MSLLLTTVATEVGEEFGSRLSAILAPTRGRPADAWARALAMHVYAEMTPGGLTLKALGEAFGRDRTTARHALQRVSRARATDAQLRRRLNAVTRRVRARR